MKNLNAFNAFPHLQQKNLPAFQLIIHCSLSLETLVDNLSQNNINNINTKFKHFTNSFKQLTDKQKVLLTQKGVYPYDYMNSFDKFQQEKFPTIEQCFSQLNKEELSQENYNRAIEVWDMFNIKNMGEYYLKTDVLLLADVFENFRSNCFTSYGALLHIA